MAPHESKTNLLSVCGANESERLNRKHDIRKAMYDGQLLHPRVPQITPDTASQIIADVATGTDIWLLDVIASNDLKPRPAAGKAQYVGIAISPAQFPAENVPGVEFVVHDALQPFPHKYLGADPRMLPEELKAGAAPSNGRLLIFLLRNAAAAAAGRRMQAEAAETDDAEEQ